LVITRGESTRRAAARDRAVDEDRGRRHGAVAGEASRLSPAGRHVVRPSAVAWLEQDFDDVIHVVVIEVRERIVWQRAGKRGTRGRTTAFETCDSPEAAEQAAAARIAALIADGYAVIDAGAGIDADAAAGSLAPPRALRAGDLTAALAAALAAVPAPPTPRALWAAFAAVMTAPRAFRAHGYRADLTVAGRLALAVIVTDPDGDLTAIGYAAGVDVPPGHAWLAADLGAIEEPWAVFAAGVIVATAWHAIADLPCASVAVETAAV
jgi:hypothetical protein